MRTRVFIFCLQVVCSTAMHTDKSAYASQDRAVNEALNAIEKSPSNEHTPPYLVSYLRHFENTSQTMVCDSLFTVIGKWLKGPCLAVGAYGNYACIGNGGAFQVLDASDPDSISVVWEYLTDGYIIDITIQDTLALVLDGFRLFIFDLSNPAQPQKLSELYISAALFDVKVSGPYAFIGRLSGFIYCVDISNPYSPYIRSYAIIPIFYPASLAIQWPYIYLGGFADPNMCVLNAANPDSLQQHNVETTIGFVRALCTTDTLLLVSGGSAVLIYSTTNPDSPAFLSKVEFEGDVYGIELRDSIAYCATSYPGVIYAVNISNPSSPYFVGSVTRSIPMIEGTGEMAISEGMIFAAFISGLFIANASPPDSMKEFGFLGTNQSSNDIVRRGDLVYVASGTSGLWTLDVSNPAFPIGISNLQTGGIAFSLTADSDFVYLVNTNRSGFPDSLEGVWTINVHNPQSPTILSVFHMRGATGITKRGDYLFVTRYRTVSNDTMMQIVDVSAPSSPYTVGAVLGNYTAYRLVATDSLVFVASQDSGLKIIDWSIPESPVILSSPTNTALGVLVEGKLVYVDLATSINIFDVSNPTAPALIGQVGREYGSFTAEIGLAKSGQYLVWEGGYHIGLFDVSDPTNPVDVGYCETYHPTGLEVSGKTIFTANGDNGVWVIERNIVAGVDDWNGGGPIPRSMRFFRNYPNPFNPETWVSFYSQKRQHIVLDVYNILGQRIETLIDGEIDEGNYRVLFSGKDLSAGLYFVRLKSDIVVLSQKILFLK